MNQTLVLYDLKAVKIFQETAVAKEHPLHRRILKFDKVVAWNGNKYEDLKVKPEEILAARVLFNGNIEVDLVDNRKGIIENGQKWKVNCLTGDGKIDFVISPD